MAIGIQPDVFIAKIALMVLCGRMLAGSRVDPDFDPLDLSEDDEGLIIIRSYLGSLDLFRSKIKR